jgi:hypothetical protein
LNESDRQRWAGLAEGGLVSLIAGIEHARDLFGRVSCANPGLIAYWMGQGIAIRRQKFADRRPRIVANSKSMTSIEACLGFDVTPHRCP